MSREGKEIIIKDNGGRKGNVSSKQKRITRSHKKGVDLGSEAKLGRQSKVKIRQKETTLEVANGTQTVLNLGREKTSD